MTGLASSAPGLPPGRLYDWLLFDADGTLFDYDRAEELALARTCAVAGVPFDGETLTLYRAINQGLWRELERGRVSPAVLKVRRFEEFLAALGKNLSALEFSENYLGHLASSADLITGAESLLQSCAGRYRLALLTNGLSRVQRSRLAGSALACFFSGVIISEEIGAAKPDAAFFARALGELGDPPPARALMIGDNWNTDIRGAVDSGIAACWFNPGGLPRPDAPEITMECASLEALGMRLLAGA